MVTGKLCPGIKYTPGAPFFLTVYIMHTSQLVIIIIVLLFS